MFGLFGKAEKEIQQRLTNIDHQLQSSFRLVKKDIQTLTGWITYLNQISQQQSNTIQLLQSQIQTSPVSKEAINSLISSHPHLQFLSSSLTQLNLKLSSVSDVPSEIKQDFHRLESRFNDLSQKVSGFDSKFDNVWKRIDELAKPKPSIKETRAQYKEKILKKITRHSKEYIKNTILSLIKKYGKISAMNLREILVEEQALCSKSSFYRFLEAIESEGFIEVFQSGKEKYYLYKMMKEA